MTLFVNLVGVTRNPRTGWRGVQLGRLALRAGAWQKASEVVPFFAMIGRPSCVIEIGAGQGGMLAGFCAAATDDATIVSVDVGGLPDEELRRHARPGPSQHLHLIRGSSHDASVRQVVAAALPGPADLLFIDGDHTYAGVKADFIDYGAFVRAGGIIALHDILPHSNSPECEVDTFWRELTGTKRGIVAPREQHPRLGGIWGGIGVVLTRPSRD